MLRLNIFWQNQTTRAEIEALRDAGNIDELKNRLLQVKV